MSLLKSVIFLESAEEGKSQSSLICPLPEDTEEENRFLHLEMHAIVVVFFWASCLGPIILQQLYLPKKNRPVELIGQIRRLTENLTPPAWHALTKLSTHDPLLR